MYASNWFHNFIKVKKKDWFTTTPWKMQECDYHLRSLHYSRVAVATFCLRKAHVCSCVFSTITNDILLIAFMICLYAKKNTPMCTDMYRNQSDQFPFVLQKKEKCRKKVGFYWAKRRKKKHHKKGTCKTTRHWITRFIYITFKTETIQLF